MLPQKRRSVADLLLSIWWVSWLGIIVGFLVVGSLEVKIEFSRGAVSERSLALLLAIPLTWIFFFIADSKAVERTPRVARLLTVAGTLVAAFTVLGIWFFVAIAARAR